jgi:hypothetical protein
MAGSAKKCAKLEPARVQDRSAANDPPKLVAVGVDE